MIFSLSGLSEAGKSTAGAHLGTRGVERLKMRRIFESIRRSGHTEYETVDAFVDAYIASDPVFLRSAFAEGLTTLISARGLSSCSIESLGDPGMVKYLGACFGSDYVPLYIEAPFERRVRYQMAEATIGTPQEARKLLASRDEVKARVFQMAAIRELPEVTTIQNSGTLAEFHNALDQLLMRYGII